MALRRSGKKTSLNEAIKARKKSAESTQSGSPTPPPKNVNSSEALRALVSKHAGDAEKAIENIPMEKFLSDHSESRIMELPKNNRTPSPSHPSANAVKNQPDQGGLGLEPAMDPVTASQLDMLVPDEVPPATGSNVQFIQDEPDEPAEPMPPARKKMPAELKVPPHNSAQKEIENLQEYEQAESADLEAAESGSLEEGFVEVEVVEIKEKATDLPASNTTPADYPKKPSTHTIRKKKNGESTSRRKPLAARSKPQQQMDERVFKGTLIAMGVMLLISALVGYFKFFRSKPEPPPPPELEAPQARYANYDGFYAAKAKYERGKKIGEEADTAMDRENWKEALDKYHVAEQTIFAACEEATKALDEAEKEVGKQDIVSKRDETVAWRRVVFPYKTRKIRCQNEMENVGNAGVDMEDLLAPALELRDQGFNAFLSGSKERRNGNFEEALQILQDAKAHYTAAVTKAQEILANSAGLQYSEVEHWNNRINMCNEEIQKAKDRSAE